MPSIRPFTVEVPQQALDDLTKRLGATRLPNAETVDDGSQGITLDEMQTVLARWRDGYDWRRVEAEINSLGSSWAQLEEGLGIHFLHVESPHADALPLLLCHGWPGSILEFRHLVGPLTRPTEHGGSASDAFHLVITSMPGFGFSDKPAVTGWNVGRIAKEWISLMRALGYGDRWAAQGGDWGSLMVETISRMQPKGLVGIHSNMPLVFPTPEEAAEADDDEKAMMADAQRYQRELSAYMQLQNTRPQAIGFALADSPIGQAAWILQLFKDVSASGGRPLEHFDLDELIDDVMLYWLPNAGASSARLYWEGAHSSDSQQSGSPPANPVPFGFSVFPHEAIRASLRWIEQRYTSIMHYHRPSRGGHFAAMENPSELVDGVRATFQPLRSASSD